MNSLYFICPDYTVVTSLRPGYRNEIRFLILEAGEDNLLRLVGSAESLVGAQVKLLALRRDPSEFQSSDELREGD